jgi:predicted ferric reductase
MILKGENKHFKEIIRPDFKLNLFISFANKESIFMMDLLNEMERLNSEYNLNIFKLNLRISSEKANRWDSYFVNENIADKNETVNKVFIVGPVAFMNDIKDIVLKSKLVDNDQIVLV